MIELGLTDCIDLIDLIDLTQLAHFGFWALPISAALGALCAFLIILAKRRFRAHSAIARQQEAVSTITLSSLPTAEIPPSQFIEVDGHRIHFVQTGLGPDILLLHGIGASIFVWRFLFPLLRARYRVTAIDLAGFGQSSKDATRDYGLNAQAELINKTIDQLKLMEPILIGSSMGGTIVLWLARLNSHRFKKVLAIAPATDPNRLPIFLIQNSLATFFLTSLLLKSVALKTIFLNSFVLRLIINKTSMRLILRFVVTRRDLLDANTVQAYVKPFRDPSSLQTLWLATRLLADQRLPSELKQVNSFTLITYGENDRIVRRESIDELMSVLPNAVLRTHPFAGHHPMEDDPEWLTQAIHFLFDECD